MDTASEHAQKRALPRLVIAVFVLTAIAMALRVVNLFFFYDIDIGYYASGEILPVVMNIFFVLAFAAISAGALIFGKEPYDATGTEKKLPVKIASLLCALGFLSPLSVIINNLLARAYFELSGITLLFLIIFALASVYFAMNFLQKTAKAQAALAIAVIFSVVYFLANSYFDLYTPMNAPEKTTLHLACITTMVFFTCEARAIIGEAKKRLYVFSLSIAVFFSGISSLPAMIAYLCGKLEYNYIVFDAVIFTLFIYLSVRLFYLAAYRQKSVAEDAADTDVTEDISGTEDISDTAISQERSANAEADSEPTEDVSETD